jgi:hypothetical protein
MWLELNILSGSIRSESTATGAILEVSVVSKHVSSRLNRFSRVSDLLDTFVFFFLLLLLFPLLVLFFFFFFFSFYLSFIVTTRSMQVNRTISEIIIIYIMYFNNTKNSLLVVKIAINLCLYTAYLTINNNRQNIINLKIEYN